MLLRCSGIQLTFKVLQATINNLHATVDEATNVQFVTTHTFRLCKTDLLLDTHHWPHFGACWIEMKCYKTENTQPFVITKKYLQCLDTVI